MSVSVYDQAGGCGGWAGGLLKDEGLPRFACAAVSKDRTSCRWCETQCNFVIFFSSLLIS